MFLFLWTKLTKDWSTISKENLMFISHFESLFSFNNCLDDITMSRPTPMSRSKLMFHKGTSMLK